MRYKGYNFRRNKNIVMLKVMAGDSKNYVRFGRIVPQGKPVPPNAEATMSVWHGPLREPVLAVPIELTGHSLTNMAYGADGRVYLAYDGWCYTALTVKEKERRDRAAGLIL